MESLDVQKTKRIHSVSTYCFDLYSYLTYNVFSWDRDCMEMMREAGGAEKEEGFVVFGVFLLLKLRSDCFVESRGDFYSSPFQIY